MCACVNGPVVCHSKHHVWVCMFVFARRCDSASSMSTARDKGICLPLWGSVSHFKPRLVHSLCLIIYCCLVMFHVHCFFIHVLVMFIGINSRQTRFFPYYYFLFICVFLCLLACFSLRGSLDCVTLLLLTYVFVVVVIYPYYLYPSHTQRPFRQDSERRVSEEITGVYRDYIKWFWDEGLKRIGRIIQTIDETYLQREWSILH